MSDCVVYALLGNIPGFYHSADLRNYFSSFVESGGFDCFHHRHRPEIIRPLPSPPEALVASSVQSSSKIETVVGDKCPAEKNKNVKGKDRTTCCVVRLLRDKFSEFMRIYNGKLWLDKKGVPFKAKCHISKIKIVEQTDECRSSRTFQTRAESRHVPTDRETFTLADLVSLPELNPPPLMPCGNIGTPTQVFLAFIQQCKLPPSIIAKLGLTFPRTRSNRRYGNVPLEYESSSPQINNDGGSRTKQRDFQRIVKNRKDTKDATTISNLSSSQLSEEVSSSVNPDNDQLDTTSPAVINTKSTNSSSGNQNERRTLFGKKLPAVDDLNKNKQNKRKRSWRSQAGKSMSDKREVWDKKEESDSDDCEEWDRYSALHDDPTNQERNTERLFEEDMEIVWEKGGSGLVWYTDAQFWDQQEGDVEEKDTDDWDLDFGPYYDPNCGDKDSHDFIRMKRDERRRQGKDVHEDEMFNAKIGQFEQYSKGIGRKLMTHQGWSDGQGLGSSVQGISEALDADDGQRPWDKRGFGYRGESKIVHTLPSASTGAYVSCKKARSDQQDRPIVSTIYDNPSVTDPEEPLLRRQEPYHLKHRSSTATLPFTVAAGQIRFVKSAETLKPH